MPRNRLWLEIVMLCATAAVLLALGLATVGASAALASANDQTSQTVAVDKYQAGAAQKFSGVVTDSMCTAKHDTSMNQSAAGCTLVCLKKGAKFALVDGDKIYFLSGGDGYLNKLAGERVVVSGTLEGDTIKVSSVDQPRP
ncbi:MAG: hypothetical protein DMG73_12665 [Acidobacteria bacterium]|jgi:hypothetical protein|nr:MAG: hypothetical protein DMG75_04490 [Acidobacteriota bacterium]PYX57614.1 MAG: hypothetical protein DMG73_12665 [Acidobacteriota bacterium]PYX64603.1 MAG: hypothetical protein DMG74_12300 [Acidobacteriota bacterium]